MRHSAHRHPRHSAPRRTRFATGYAVLAMAGVTSAVLLLEGSPVAWATASAVTVSSAQQGAVLAGDMAVPVTPVALVLPARTTQTAAAAAAKALAVKPVAKPAAVKAVKKPAVAPYRFGTKRFNLWYAETYEMVKYRWNFTQFICLARMWGRESAWNQYAWNHASGARGIPQAQPGYKMARFGKDWRTNPTVQIRWGLAYIKGTYGNPCRAWSFWQRHHWY